MVKQLHKNYSLLIALDLSQSHYQNLLIISLKYTVKNVEIKTANLNVSLKDLKITNFLIGVMGVRKKTVTANKWIN